MFFISFDLQDSSGTVSGKSKDIGKVGLFFVSFDLQDSSGTVSGKNLFGHTPIGLFLGRKLIYFSVLYYGIGEISGIFKILRKDFRRRILSKSG
jgi:hypothetical protein